MNRDNYRDYVTDAYRYYALCGRPDASELRQLRTTHPQIYRGGVADLEAVQRVLERLEYEQDSQVLMQCLEIVYFSNPKNIPSRGTLTDRVRFAALELCISESTVYRMLRRLRMLLALERGLRVDERELIGMWSETREVQRAVPPPEHGGWYGGCAEA